MNTKIYKPFSKFLKIRTRRELNTVILSAGSSFKSMPSVRAISLKDLKKKIIIITAINTLKGKQHVRNKNN